jgi:hypothetical protein
MNTKEWYRAHLRWAVMVDGKEGLRCWEDCIYMLLNSDHATAFQQALKIGRREESIRMEERSWVEKRFVEVLQLEGCGIDAKEITAHWETQKPDKPLPFSHFFSPEGLHHFRYFRNILPIPRPALRPNRVSLRAPQDFAPAGESGP